MKWTTFASVSIVLALAATANAQGIGCCGQSAGATVISGGCSSCDPVVCGSSGSFCGWTRRCNGCPVVAGPSWSFGGGSCCGASSCGFGGCGGCGGCGRFGGCAYSGCGGFGGCNGCGINGFSNFNGSCGWTRRCNGCPVIGSPNWSFHGTGCCNVGCGGCGGCGRFGGCANSGCGGCGLGGCGLGGCGLFRKHCGGCAMSGCDDDCVVSDCTTGCTTGGCTAGCNSGISSTTIAPQGQVIRRQPVPAQTPVHAQPQEVVPAAPAVEPSKETIVEPETKAISDRSVRRLPKTNSFSL